MKLRQMPAVLLLAAATGCESILDVQPEDELPQETAIGDASGARAALAGAYDAMQAGGYYETAFPLFGDLSSNNAIHSGTLTSYGDADANQLRADNGTIETIWQALYDAINRTNVILQRVPVVPGLADAERDEILGEAHFLRALHYHNLVKLFGGVPLVTVPPASVAEASQVVRAPVSDVYDLILDDLAQAGQLITNETDARSASQGAVHALLARVHLYLADWQSALDEADAVVALGYELVPDFGDLFTEEGDDTPEDIFRIGFTAEDFTNIGWYYTSDAAGGRGELAPDPDIVAAFEPTDERFLWSLSLDDDDEYYVSKYPTTVGAEDLHVIRFAEVLLIKAEAHAQLNQLQEAVDTYNLLRERAELAPHVLGVDVTTQAEVLDAIYLERRRELAFEGDWWADLVRRGVAGDVLGIPVTQTLYPIPLSEITVAPGLEPNPGY
jgi:hypothetical protein